MANVSEITEEQIEAIRKYHAENPDSSKRKKGEIPELPTTMDVYFIDDQIWLRNKKGQKLAGGMGSVRLLQKLDDPSQLMMLKVYKAKSSLEDTSEKRQRSETQSTATRRAILSLGQYSQSFLRESAGKHNVRKHYALMPYEKGLPIEEVCNYLIDARGKPPTTPEFNEAARLNVAKNCVKALQDLHDQNRIHGDINPGNIMVKNQQGEVGLIDFDASIEYDPITKTAKPSEIVRFKGFAAPELATHYTVQTDIFALGKILQLVLPQIAYRQDAVLSKMLATDPTERPSLEEVATRLDVLFKEKCPNPDVIPKFKKIKSWEIKGIDAEIKKVHEKLLGISQTTQAAPGVRRRLPIS